MKNKAKQDDIKNASRAQVTPALFVLFVIGVGGIFALSNRLVQTSKSQAWTPIAVTSSMGVTRLYDDFMRDSVLVHVKNQDTKTIVIRGVSASGSTDMLFSGTESVGNWNHPMVNGDACDPEHNAARQCSITIAPGAEIALQLNVPNGALCNRDFTDNPYSPPSINSVKKAAATTLTVYYQYSGIIPAPATDKTAQAKLPAKKAGMVATAGAFVKSTIISAATSQPNTGMLSKSYSLTVPCFDYWLCKPDEYVSQACISKYETNKAHWCVKGGCGYSFVG